MPEIVHYVISIAPFPIFFLFPKGKKEAPASAKGFSSFLFQFKGSCIELIILSFFLNQLFMTSPFDDMSVLQHHNNV